MELFYKDIKINLEIPKGIDAAKETMLFLHGFTGSAEEWFPIIEQLPDEFNYAALDLIGHGKSDKPVNPDYYTSDSIVEQIKFVKDKISPANPLILIGYSMGGRAAISFAVAYPKDVKGLVLESASAGIKNDTERKKRYEDDIKLVQFIHDHTMEEFIELWYDQEMFNTQRRFSNDKIKKLHKKKYDNSKIGMTNILKGFSTGIMPPLHDKLKSIPVKTVLISGELDSKYTFINSKIVRRFHKAKHKVVKNSGHNTHLEEPKRFIEIITNYLNQLLPAQVQK
ncbi:2-succinyl-6-hydroxy-2,4-cyclohexadiene-1-carboxylate synthase [Ignavibacterium sp.]|uniref:2-succinyl-6-hydroxy-2, 4-cyclohexadiene-1-carboxylate synthase n=1 Tax=Ignavibacterium sp. TaxID=2651167 RepID=UPI00307DCE68